MIQPRPTLDPLFRPRSIAVIGASRNRGTIAAEVFHNLVSHGFPGPVFPVNPGSGAVQSVKAYASAREIPEPVDLAVIVVPQRLVLGAIDDCAAAGIRGVVVITAGFAEIGGEGRELQAEIARRVRAHGMRMIGPNCVGVMNTDPALKLNATFAPTWPPAGSVAIASQSGAVGVALLDYARALGIGISQFASTGNKADVSGNDLLEYWEEDAATRVIGMYLESFGNPVRFMQIARRVSRRKPILVVKSGRTAAGARAASSHTGALAGMDVAVDALLGQAGVLRTDTMEELFHLAALLSNQPVPAGPRVAILTNAGGPGIMASDACESRGLTLAELSPGTAATLRSFLPREASVANPVDMIAGASAEHYERALRAVLQDDGVDSVLALFVPPLVTEARDVAESLARAAEGATKPVVVALVGTYGVPAGQEALRRAKVPVYNFPEPAVLALSRAVRYGRWLDRPEGTAPPLDDVSPERARAVIAKRGEGWLSASEAFEVLAAYGIRGPRTIAVNDGPEAARAAEGLGFPVALKLASDRVLHKTEVGGVALNLKSAEEVRTAYEAMQAQLASHGLTGVSGAIVQEMVRGGVETFVGVTQAAGFGALLAFGIGGTNVEVWKDVAFRVHPITDVDAREMLDQIRARVLLDGFRGGPHADRDALADAILRVDRMISDLPEIQELDVNPLLALAPGRGVVALDARIRVAPREP